jgi:ABC-type phosphate transport system permease subunit
MFLSVVLAGVGVGIAYVVVNQVTNQIDMEVPMISEDAGFEIAQLGGAMALFYVLILGFLLIPTVGRVYRDATSQVAATEKRFRVRSDEPRDHFKPEHDVQQL